MASGRSPVLFGCGAGRYVMQIPDGPFTRFPDQFRCGNRLGMVQQFVQYSWNTSKSRRGTPGSVLGLWALPAKLCRVEQQGVTLPKWFPAASK